MVSLLATGAQQYIEQMPAAIAIFDDELRYRAVSHRHLAELSLMYSVEAPAPQKVIGRIFLRYGQACRRAGWTLMPACWGARNCLTKRSFVTRPDGRRVWVRWSLKPWRDMHGQIGGALLFGELITEQVEMRHALADSEARFRATFENAAVGISHVAPDGRFLRFKKALFRLLGCPADELITKSVWEITHPDNLAIELAQFQQLEDGRIDSYSVDKRDLRKDGTIVWLRLTRSCVRKSDGSVDYFVAVVEDISPRKRAEEQVHLVMREANHRVKSPLGLVQAVARQIAAGNPEDFVGRFSERVQALAVNQDLLGRDKRRGAHLEKLVRAQLAHFADLVGSRITAHGPKLHLNATAAQAIGLALHELATNAAKYGALSTDAGRVDLDWRLDGDSFVMSWAERGGPPVQPPDHRGFGTTVVDALARRAVGGEVQLDYARSGVEWHLTCPRDNALEP
jgi:PAS domain S-box-containing protein